MSYYKALLLAFSARLLVGCAEALPMDTPAIIDPRPAVEDLEANIARLQALEVFGVGELIVDYPAGSMNCYGPCPGHEEAISAARDNAEARLAAFVPVSEAAARRAPADDVCSAARVEENLVALEDLRVVRVSGLIEAVPENNPNCYNLPCRDDVEAADAVNCARAGQLENIVDAGQALFPGAVDPASALEAIDENLGRLQALRMVEVGQLIIDVPAEAMNCYGPCPGYEDMIEEARATSAVRLQSLTTVAEAAAAAPVREEMCLAESIDANLAALRELRIVEIGGFVVAEPANNPSCYNLPCQEDIEAADATTCERAGVLANTVAGADDL